MDDIINGIWCIGEELFWDIPAHNYTYKEENAPLPNITEPIIDFFAVETSVLLACVYYLIKKS